MGWQSSASTTRSRDKVMVYADFAQGFRDGGTNSGYPQGATTTACRKVRARHAQQLRNRLENHQSQRPPGVERRGLPHALEAAADAHLRRERLRAYSFNVNVGNARIYGMESNIDYKINENWSLQAAGSYTDSRLRHVRDRCQLPSVRGRATAVRALLQLELERALRTSARRQAAAATRSSTWPTRATCGTTCIVNDVIQRLPAHPAAGLHHFKSALRVDP